MRRGGSDIPSAASPAVPGVMAALRGARVGPTAGKCAKSGSLQQYCRVPHGRGRATLGPDFGNH